MPNAAGKGIRSTDITVEHYLRRWAAVEEADPATEVIPEAKPHAGVDKEVNINGVERLSHIHVDYTHAPFGYARRFKICVLQLVAPL